MNQILLRWRRQYVWSKSSIGLEIWRGTIQRILYRWCAYSSASHLHRFWRQRHVTTATTLEVILATQTKYITRFLFRRIHLRALSFNNTQKSHSQLEKSRKSKNDNIQWKIIIKTNNLTMHALVHHWPDALGQETSKLCEIFRTNCNQTVEGKFHLPHSTALDIVLESSDLKNVLSCRLIVVWLLSLDDAWWRLLIKSLQIIVTASINQWLDLSFNQLDKLSIDQVWSCLCLNAVDLREQKHQSGDLSINSRASWLFITHTNNHHSNIQQQKGKIINENQTNQPLSLIILFFNITHSLNHNTQRIQPQ